MLSIEEVKSLPIGKGIRIINPFTRPCSRTYSYNALVTAPMTKEDAENGLRLITENGRLSRPLFRNYGKTWAVETAY